MPIYQTKIAIIKQQQYRRTEELRLRYSSLCNSSDAYILDELASSSSTQIIFPMILHHYAIPHYVYQHTVMIYIYVYPFNTQINSLKMNSIPLFYTM